MPARRKRIKCPGAHQVPNWIGADDADLNEMIARCPECGEKFVRLAHLKGLSPEAPLPKVPLHWVLAA